MDWKIAIPIIAIILTLIVMLLLWYWWSSSREEQRPDTPIITDSPPDSQPSQGWMRMIALEMGMFYALRDWLRASFPRLMPQSSGAASGSRTIPARQTGELVEAIRLFRDLATGGLVVEIGSRRYSALSEMTDDTIRRRFLGIAESMAQFASGEAPSPAVNVPAAVVTSPVIASTMPVTSPSSPRMGLSDTSKGEQTDKPAPVVLKSVAEEIEELLQYRLTITPEYNQRSIHIREAHGGAIQVEVDGHYYDGIGEVNDETVKTFLQAIVREWEART